MRQLLPNEEEAIRALAELSAKLTGLADKGVGHPEFASWRRLTHDTFERWLRTSVYSSRFAQICFDKPPLASASDISMGADFMRGLAAARKCLEEAIEYIEYFGLEQPRT
jgi:hypothetical protein